MKKLMVKINDIDYVCELEITTGSLNLSQICQFVVSLVHQMRRAVPWRLVTMTFVS